jgi:hypothetical protein
MSLLDSERELGQDRRKTVTVINLTMWNILDSYGIPAEILKVILNLYTDVTCKVIHNSQVGISM